MAPSDPESSNDTSNSSTEEAIESFNLLIDIMSPAGFAKLLQARVRHLIKAWPPQPSSSIKEPPSLPPTNSDAYFPSFESIRAFANFFRPQDSPSPLDTPNDAASLNALHDHLLRLQTVFSFLSGRELQALVRDRLNEGGKERPFAIQGLMDVMRNTSNDESAQKTVSFGLEDVVLQDRKVSSDGEQSKGAYELMERVAQPSTPLLTASTSKRKAPPDEESPPSVAPTKSARKGLSKKRRRLGKNEYHSMEVDSPPIVQLDTEKSDVTTTDLDTPLAAIATETTMTMEIVTVETPHNDPSQVSGHSNQQQIIIPPVSYSAPASHPDGNLAAPEGLSPDSTILSPVSSKVAPKKPDSEEEDEGLVVTLIVEPTTSSTETKGFPATPPREESDPSLGSEPSTNNLPPDAFGSTSNSPLVDKPPKAQKKPSRRKPFQPSPSISSPPESHGTRQEVNRRLTRSAAGVAHSKFKKLKPPAAVGNGDKRRSKRIARATRSSKRIVTPCPPWPSPPPPSLPPSPKPELEPQFSVAEPSVSKHSRDQLSTAEPSIAVTSMTESLIVQPSMAEPLSAELSIEEPSNEEPFSTAKPSTADPSAADSPAADSPAADSPAADSPAADSPAADSPAADSPAADPSAADPPAADPDPSIARPTSIEPGRVDQEQDIPPDFPPSPALSIHPDIPEAELSHHSGSSKFSPPPSPLHDFENRAPSPPGPVLRAVDWSNGDRSVNISSDIDEVDEVDDDVLDDFLEKNTHGHLDWKRNIDHSSYGPDGGANGSASEGTGEQKLFLRLPAPRHVEDLPETHISSIQDPPVPPFSSYNISLRSQNGMNHYNHNVSNHGAPPPHSQGVPRGPPNRFDRNHPMRYNPQMHGSSVPPPIPPPSGPRPSPFPRARQYPHSHQPGPPTFPPPVAPPHGYRSLRLGQPPQGPPGQRPSRPLGPGPPEQHGQAHYPPPNPYPPPYHRGPWFGAMFYVPVSGPHQFRTSPHGPPSHHTQHHPHVPPLVHHPAPPPPPGPFGHPQRAGPPVPPANAQPQQNPPHHPHPHPHPHHTNSAPLLHPGLNMPSIGPPVHPGANRRAQSPIVKPPEGPKRIFSKKPVEEEVDEVASPSIVEEDDPNVQYTDDVGVKESPVVKRRCFNCRSSEAPS
ncbi:hypothetical protein BU17DRAFT_66489 [Hysterangium stoloniferum]|nr:hypothetical protein BU17DRAFT_66489 [Hysterangium stoloniferum]